MTFKWYLIDHNSRWFPEVCMFPSGSETTFTDFSQVLKSYIKEQWKWGSKMHKPALQYLQASLALAWTITRHGLGPMSSGAMQIQEDTVFKTLENDVNVSFT